MDALLRDYHQDVNLAHPTVEELSHYAGAAQRLAAAQRQAIEEHLTYCPSCREEVAFVTTAMPALVRSARETGSPSQVERAHSSMATQIWTALRSWLWHPAFAYTLLMLLSIPWLLERGPVPVYFSPASPSSSHTSTDLHFRARAFLLHDYKAAYEARDIRLLAHIWPMSDQWRGNLEQLFTESQRILLLLDIDEPASTAREDGHSIAVPVVQAVTITDRHGRLSLKGPFFCIADLRLDNNGQWSIVDFREDPYQPGSCRPPA
jgi:hypothetical protein